MYPYVAASIAVVCGVAYAALHYDTKRILSELHNSLGTMDDHRKGMEHIEEIYKKTIDSIREPRVEFEERIKGEESIHHAVEYTFKRYEKLDL